MVTAVAAHPGKFGKKVRSPEVQAAVRGAVGAGDGTIDFVARRNVIPLAAAAVVGPGGKSRELLGLAFGTGAGQLVGKFVPGGQQPPLKDLPLIAHFFHKGADLPLVLAVKIVLEADPGFGNPIPGGGGHLGEKGTTVARSLTRKAQKLLLPLFAQAVLGRRGKPPAGVHVVQVGFGPPHAGQSQTLEHGHFARGNDHFVRGSQHFLPQLAKKIKMPGPRPQGGLLHNAVNVAEFQVVLGGDFEVIGAVLNELRRGALPGLEAALNGGGPFGRDDRIVAVRKHQPLVRQANGLGPAGTALGNDRNDRHPQPCHAVNVAGDLLGRAGIVLNGKRAGRKNVGVDGDALGFGHAHILLGLGVAPGLYRTAVAELRAVALFLTDNHNRLGIGLLAPAAGNHRAGNEHAGVQAVFVLAAHLGKVVVDVFKNVAQADALGVAHNAHPIHGGNARFQAAFHIAKEVFHRGQLGKGVLQLAGAGAGLKSREFFFQQLGIVPVLADKDVCQIRESVTQILNMLFYRIVHNGYGQLDCFFEMGERLACAPLSPGKNRIPHVKNAGCVPYWPSESPRWT